jgi:hypothetical protein
MKELRNKLKQLCKHPKHIDVVIEYINKYKERYEVSNLDVALDITSSASTIGDILSGRQKRIYTITLVNISTIVPDDCILDYYFRSGALDHLTPLQIKNLQNETKN